MRYFTGFLIAIGLIVLLFIIILKSGGNSTPPQQQINLASYANTSAITQMTIDGPTNADQTHVQVQVSVGQSETTFQIVNGYQGRIQSSKTYASNENAYSAFLQSLAVAGFTRGTKINIPNKQGYCPSGDRYTFQLMQTGSNIINYWATSCGSGQGTFKGDVNTVLNLFQQQVPDYDDLTGSLQL